MCLAIPTRILEIDGSRAQAEAGGVRREISIELTPGVKPGDYVIVHAGFAIERLREEEARETLKIFAEMEEKYAPGG